MGSKSCGRSRFPSIVYKTREQCYVSVVMGCFCALPMNKKKSACFPHTAPAATAATRPRLTRARVMLKLSRMYVSFFALGVLAAVFLGLYVACCVEVCLASTRPDPFLDHFFFLIGIGPLFFLSSKEFETEVDQASRTKRGLPCTALQAGSDDSLDRWATQPLVCCSDPCSVRREQALGDGVYYGGTI